MPSFRTAFLMPLGLEFDWACLLHFHSNSSPGFQLHPFCAFSAIFQRKDPETFRNSTVASLFVAFWSISRNLFRPHLQVDIVAPGVVDAIEKTIVQCR